jgi:SAM-dependent methyltransferase
MSEHRNDPSLTPEEWQAWFSVQAGWTQPTRLWLYRQAGLAQAGDILEVGCGTGVVAGEMARLGSARVVGLDIDSEIGNVLACAEPDYGGRVDHPPEMVSLGRLQAEALRQQGADPEIGRRLGELFVAAGLQATVGVMAGRWSLPASTDEGFEAEWAMREHDLAGLVPSEELCRLRSADRLALADGQRTLFVPTFYALGKKML